MSFPFLYPTDPHVRRHGPRGYSDHSGYRDWLRDEFSFRCVYCLLRERWVPGGFHVDHLLPEATHPEQATRYENLIYCCSTCNVSKGSYVIPDPTQHLVASAVSILPDGTLLPKTRESTIIVEHLGLNRPHYSAFRRMWMGAAAAISVIPALRAEVFGFPVDLPDLSVLRPPGGNSRPEGIDESYLRRRERGELPETY